MTLNVSLPPSEPVNESNRTGAWSGERVGFMLFVEQDDRRLGGKPQLAGDLKAWLGRSRAPYTTWTWRETPQQIGGPNFIRLPDGALWATGRRYPGGPRTVLARLSLDGGYEPALTLPSGGDTSYAGMVWHEGLLWVSYYASHEGKSAIYLARVKLP
jgi:hypothetical protein